MCAARYPSRGGSNQTQDRQTLANVSSTVGRQSRGNKRRGDPKNTHTHTHTHWKMNTRSQAELKKKHHLQPCKNQNALFRPTYYPRQITLINYQLYSDTASRLLFCLTYFTAPYSAVTTENHICLSSLWLFLCKICQTIFICAFNS